MEIKEFMFVVSSHYPLTSCAIEEHYYNNIDAAKACFNELCAANPDVVEYGVMTMFDDMSHDTYRVIMTRK